ncbi:hypothetical protein DSECCO2_632410 [anaerobic digester metagenome]
MSGHGLEGRVYRQKPEIDRSAPVVQHHLVHGEAGDQLAEQGAEVMLGGTLAGHVAHQAEHRGNASVHPAFGHQPPVEQHPPGRSVKHVVGLHRAARFQYPAQLACPEFRHLRGKAQFRHLAPHERVRRAQVGSDGSVDVGQAQVATEAHDDVRSVFHQGAVLFLASGKVGQGHVALGDVLVDQQQIARIGAADEIVAPAAAYLVAVEERGKVLGNAAAPRTGQGLAQGGDHRGWQQAGQQAADAFGTGQAAQPFPRRVDVQQGEVGAVVPMGVHGAQHHHARVHVAEYAAKQFGIAPHLFHGTGGLPVRTGCPALPILPDFPGLSDLLIVQFRRLRVFRTFAAVRAISSLHCTGPFCPATPVPPGTGAAISDDVTLLKSHTASTGKRTVAIRPCIVVQRRGSNRLAS